MQALEPENWKSVVEFLDQTCEGWNHEVVSVKQIGDLVAITASVTVGGTTRQGIGTGSAYEEEGIKSAELNALVRAAMKFGVARELCKVDAVSPSAGLVVNGVTFPPVIMSKTMAELVTPKQLVAIRVIANSGGINAEAECRQLLHCQPEELNRRSASAFIDYLKTKQS